MTNKALKRIFKDLSSTIAKSVSPDSVIDDLLSKNVISEDDYCILRQVSVSADRCQELLSLLYLSSHPQVFIFLRLALLDEYPWIVDKIDEQVPPLTSQLLQLQPNCSSDGKCIFLRRSFALY